MSKRAIFTQADVARVLRGARSADTPLSRIEIDLQGKIVAHIGKPEETSDAAVDEWDKRISAKTKRASALRN